MPEMQGLDIRGFNKDTFEAFMLGEVKTKLATSKWNVQSATLHNTGSMKWPGVVGGKAITPQQRIRNMSVDWVSRKFKGGVHIIVAPDGGIWTCWPLWKPGTHSPSFNSTHWSVEVVGDFRTERPTKAQAEAITAVLTAMAKTIGGWRFLNYFKFHKEDPRTSHKSCPGINLGNKAYWVAEVRTKLGYLPTMGGAVSPSYGIADLGPDIEAADLSDAGEHVPNEDPAADEATPADETRKEKKTMNFKTMIKLHSKTFWVGLLMIAAGAYKLSGIDIPVVPDLELLKDIAPENGATLIKGGLIAIFIRDAIPGK